MSNRPTQQRRRPPPDPDPEPAPGSGPGPGPSPTIEGEQEDEDDNGLGDRSTLGFGLPTTSSASSPAYTTRPLRHHSQSHPSLQAHLEQRHQQQQQQNPYADLEQRQQEHGVDVDARPRVEEEGQGSTRRTLAHTGIPTQYGDDLGLGLGLGLDLEPHQTQVQAQAQAQQAPAISGQELSAGPRQRQLQHQHQHQQHLLHRQLEQHQRQRQRQNQHQNQHQHLRQQQRPTATALAAAALELEGHAPSSGPPGPQAPQAQAPQQLQLHLHDSHQPLDHGQHHIHAPVTFLPPGYHLPIGPPQPQPHHSHHPHHPHPSQHQHQHQHQQHHQHQVYAFAAHPPLVDPAAPDSPTSSPPPPPPTSSSSGTILCHPHDPRLLQAAQLQAIPWFPADSDPDPGDELRHYIPPPSDFFDSDHQPHPHPPHDNDNDDRTFYHHHHQQQEQHHQRPQNWPFIQLPDGQTVLSMHPELSILNAESYHDGTASSFRAPRSLPPRPTPTPTTPGAEEGRTRHRQRESRHHGTKRSTAQAGDALDDGDMPDKKKRGRPKLDTDDQTAQDRRRTQIRLAQRAYRNRKETAILTLEKQVEELKQNNEQMSNAFMRLYDYAVSHGMLESMPEFGRQLQATTETFVSLARRTSEDNARQAPPGAEPESEEGNTGSPGSGSEKQRHASGSPDVATANIVSTTNGQQILMAGIMVSHEQDHTYEEAVAGSDMSVWSQRAQTSSSAPAYEIVTQPTVHNASFPFGTSTSHSAESLAAATLLLTTPYLPSSGPMIPGPTHALPPPTSLSYQERTFGRRLQRAALEQALRLMAMPDPPPTIFAAVFGFCLLFESRDRIVERIANCLSVNRRETLSNWRHPFLHLGGAGTFFQELNEMDHVAPAGDPKAKGTEVEDDSLEPAPPQPPVGNQGTDEPNRSKVARESIYGQGPWNPLVEETKDLRVDQRLRIMTPGFEGDFFDCDEVEWYLHQRGVVVPPAADFISAEIDDATFGRTTSALAPASVDVGVEKSPVWLPGDLGLGGRTLVLTPGNTSDSWSAPTVTGDEEMEALFGASLPPNLMDTPMLVEPSFYDLSGLGPEKALSPRKRLVTIDVQALVDELIQRSVCLGRAPGIRPKDVDAAFWKAVV